MDGPAPLRERGRVASICASALSRLLTPSSARVGAFWFGGKVTLAELAQRTGMDAAAFPHVPINERLPLFDPEWVSKRKPCEMLEAELRFVSLVVQLPEVLMTHGATGMLVEVVPLHVEVLATDWAPGPCACPRAAPR